MKRVVLLAVAAGAVTIAGVTFGMQAAESGHRGGDGYRGSWGGHDGGHGWRHGRRGGRFGKRRGMRRMMKRFDANGDRQLTQDEVTNGRRALIEKHDADGNGQLTLSEFENLWLEMRRRRMVSAFQRLDDDGDAVVSTDEFMEPFANIVERMDRNGDGVLDKQDRRGRGWRHNRRHREGRKQRRNDGAAE